MRITKIVRLLTVLLIFPFALAAQVTTGSISGNVKDAKGADLTGADFSEAKGLNDKLFEGAKYCHTKMPSNSKIPSSYKVVNPNCWSFSILGLKLGNS